jgi:hypothetical protein
VCVCKKIYLVALVYTEALIAEITCGRNLPVEITCPETSRGKVPVATDFKAVFSIVRAAFRVTFRSLAAEGAPFCSYIVLGLRCLYDLRNSITKIECIVEFTYLPKKRFAKIMPRFKNIGALIGRQLARRRG